MVPCRCTLGELDWESAFSEGMCPEGVTPGRTQRHLSHWWGNARPEGFSSQTCSDWHLSLCIWLESLVVRGFPPWLELVPTVGILLTGWRALGKSRRCLRSAGPAGLPFHRPVSRLSERVRASSEGPRSLAPHPITPATRLARQAAGWISRAWGRDPQGPSGFLQGLGGCLAGHYSFPCVATAALQGLPGTHPGLQPHHHTGCSSRFPLDSGGVRLPPALQPWALPEPSPSLLSANQPWETSCEWRR